nr:immunoglobulin-like and fibronectin type III domain-containing protein 1 isoform X3 [Anolis sagrei ordinatus]
MSGRRAVKTKKSAVPGVTIAQFVEDIPKGYTTPDFERKPITLTLSEGKNAIFRAVVKGEPKPEMLWKRSTGKMDDPDRYQTTFIPGTNEFTLQINKITQDDADVYRFTAVNDYGEATCSAGLKIIQVGFKKKAKVAPPTPQKDLKKEIEDFKKTLKKRSPQAAQKKEIDPDQVWQLLLNADKKDYEKICLKYGIVDFRGMLRQLQEMKKEREDKQAQYVYNIANLKHVRVNQEQANASFDVEMELKNLESRIYLYKDGEMINFGLNDDNVKHCLRQVGKKYNFIINDLQPEDAGVYQIKIEDVDIFSTELEGENIPVYFRYPLDEARCHEQGNAVFQCTLYEPCFNAVWFHKKNQLKPNDKYEISVSNDGLTHHLVIKNAQPSDKGTYTIDIGRRTSSAWLDVESKGKRKQTEGNSNDKAGWQSKLLNEDHAKKLRQGEGHEDQDHLDDSSRGKDDQYKKGQDGGAELFSPLGKEGYVGKDGKMRQFSAIGTNNANDYNHQMGLYGTDGISGGTVTGEFSGVGGAAGLHGKEGMLGSFGGPGGPVGLGGLYGKDGTTDGTGLGWLDGTGDVGGLYDKDGKQIGAGVGGLRAAGSIGGLYDKDGRAIGAGGSGLYDKDGKPVGKGIGGFYDRDGRPVGAGLDGLYDKDGRPIGAGLGGLYDKDGRPIGTGGSGLYDKDGKPIGAGLGGLYDKDGRPIGAGGSGLYDKDGRPIGAGLGGLYDKDGRPIGAGLGGLYDKDGRPIGTGGSGLYDKDGKPVGAGLGGLYDKDGRPIGAGLGGLYDKDGRPIGAGLGGLYDKDGRPIGIGGSGLYDKDGKPISAGIGGFYDKDGRLIGTGLGGLYDKDGRPIGAGIGGLYDKDGRPIGAGLGGLYDKDGKPIGAGIGGDLYGKDGRPIGTGGSGLYDKDGKPISAGIGGFYDKDGRLIGTGLGGLYDKDGRPIGAGIGGLYDKDGRPIGAGIGGLYDKDGKPIGAGIGGGLYDKDGKPIGEGIAGFYDKYGSPIGAGLGGLYDKDGKPIQSGISGFYDKDGKPIGAEVSGHGCAGGVGGLYDKDGKPIGAGLGGLYDKDGKAIGAGIGGFYDKDGRPIGGGLGVLYDKDGRLIGVGGSGLYDKDGKPIGAGIGVFYDKDGKPIGAGIGGGLYDKNGRPIGEGGGGLYDKDGKSIGAGIGGFYDKDGKPVGGGLGLYDKDGRLIGADGSGLYDKDGRRIGVGGSGLYDKDGMPIVAGVGGFYDKDGRLIGAGGSGLYDKDGKPIATGLGGFYDKDGKPIGAGFGGLYDKDGKPIGAGIGGFYDKDGKPVGGGLGGLYDKDGKLIGADGSGIYDKDGRPIEVGGSALYDKEGRPIGAGGSGLYDKDGKPIVAGVGGFYDKDGRLIGAGGSGLYDKDGKPIVAGIDGFYDKDGKLIGASASGLYDKDGRPIGAGLGGLYDKDGKPIGAGISGLFDKDGKPIGAGIGGLYDKDGKPIAAGVGGLYDKDGRPFGAGLGGIFDKDGKPIGAGGIGLYDKDGRPIGAGSSGLYDKDGKPIGAGVGGLYDKDGRPVGAGFGGLYDKDGKPIGAGISGLFDKDGKPIGAGIGGLYDKDGMPIGTGGSRLYDKDGKPIGAGINGMITVSGESEAAFGGVDGLHGKDGMLNGSGEAGDTRGFARLYGKDGMLIGAGSAEGTAAFYGKDGMSAGIGPGGAGDISGLGEIGAGVADGARRAGRFYDKDGMIGEGGGSGGATGLFGQDGMLDRVGAGRPGGARGGAGFFDKDGMPVGAGTGGTGGIYSMAGGSSYGEAGGLYGRDGFPAGVGTGGAGGVDRLYGKDSMLHEIGAVGTGHGEGGWLGSRRRQLSDLDVSGLISVDTSSGRDRKRRGGSLLEDDIREPYSRFTQGLFDVHAQKGRQAVLSCSLNNDQLEGIWFKDGFKITDLDGISIKKEGSLHKLIIDEVQDKHAGKYKFEAEGVRTEASIFVEDPPNVDSALLEKLKKEPIVVKAGKNAIVKIPFEGQKPIRSSWLKDEGELLDDARINTEYSDNYTRLCISSANRKDCGEYKVKLRNESGSTEATLKLIVIDKPQPPTGPVEVVETSTSGITIQWKPPKDEGGKPIQSYVIERQQVGRKTWVTLGETTGNSTIFTTNKVEQDKSYYFRVRAVNAEGTSEVLESDEVMAASKVFPGPPAPPKIISANRGAITLSWAAPHKTGNSRILGYTVEKSKKGSNTWIPVTDLPITEKKYTVTDLKEGLLYEFRVAAINSAGTGEASAPSEAVFARDPMKPPGPVKDLKVVNTDYCSISLSWTKPGKEEESPVKGYIVDMRHTDMLKWTQCNALPIPMTAYIVRGLKPREMYFLRVRAVNDGGFGEPVELDSYVQTIPPIVQPKVLVKDTVKSFMIVKAGDTIRVRIPFEASPPPEVYWLKDGHVLTAKATTATREGVSQLIIPAADFSDSGHYSIVLKSEHGKKETFSFLVQVLDVPEAPGPIQLVERVPDTVTLMWEPSPTEKRDRNLNYMVMRRDSSKGSWHMVADLIYTNKCTVANFVPGRDYFFRVLAKNCMGVSEPSETVQPWSIHKERGKFEVKLPKYKGINQKQPPRFLVLLKPHVVTLGFDCHMSCAVTGYPPPRVTWYKDGKNISKDPTFFSKNDLGVCSLVIPGVAASDAGEYMVVAINELGEASSKAGLAIKDPVFH